MIAALAATAGGEAAFPATRVMVVDDSIVTRSVIDTILKPHPRFRIVATASGAAQALEALGRIAVDVVLLDLAMPGMDGLTALPEIIRRGRGARVLVVSASAGAGADACVRALALGAADTLEKPAAGYGDRFADALIDKLARIGAEGPAADPLEPAAGARVARMALSPRVEGPVECLAIGASTGGIHALSAFFAALPQTCTAPILVTQHLPAAFMSYFAAQLATMTGRAAMVARPGDALRRGTILVASGEAHLRLARSGKGARILFDPAPAPSGCLPSVDPMFEAVAETFGPRGFGVVLSGMGRDGLIGARRLVAAGAEVAAQDAASSTVWGMPGSVAAAGLAATIDAPAAIARRIADRVAGGRAS